MQSGGLGAAGRHADLRARIRGAAEAGLSWIQIREKSLSGRELLALVKDAVEIAGSSNDSRCTKIIVNDRLDVALAASAEGVHLGRESAPIDMVVKWCRNGNAPRDFLVGASCHSAAEAREAVIAGASYLIFGPVFDTPSKRAFGEPVGIEQLQKVCEEARIPVLAIGGVDFQNARDCLRAGAAGIAAIRMFQDASGASELKQVVKTLQNL